MNSPKISDLRATNPPDGLDLLRTAIELRDIEIARLNDHIERLALDLALKETDNKVVTK